MSNTVAAIADRHQAPLGLAKTEQSIPERFAQVVAQHASHVAISANSVEWTYAELNERSNTLAGQILER